MSQDHLFSFQQFIIGLLQLSSRHRSDWDTEEIASLLYQITGREFQYAPPSASTTSSSENIPASETPDKSPSPQHPDSPTPSQSNNTDQPGYNQCTREWEKELKQEQPEGLLVLNGLAILNTNYDNLCRWRFEDRLPKTGATGRQE